MRPIVTHGTQHGRKNCYTLHFANFGLTQDDNPKGTTLVLNAPQVANDTGKSGSVVDIDSNRKTVTLNLLGGWVDGQFTLYLHTDASSELVAALESGTHLTSPKSSRPTRFTTRPSGV